MEVKSKHEDGKATLEGWHLNVLDECADVMRELVLKGIAEAWDLLSKDSGIYASMPMYWYPGNGQGGPAPDDPLTIQLRISIGDFDGEDTVHSFSLTELFDEDIRDADWHDPPQLEGFRIVRNALQKIVERIDEQLSTANAEQKGG